MELASSSSVRTFPLREGGVTVDGGGFVPSCSSSSFGVLVSGGRQSRRFVRVSGCNSFTVLRGKLVCCTTGTELGRSGGGVWARRGGLGLVLCPDSWICIGNAAGPSGRVARMEAGCCHDLSSSLYCIRTNGRIYSRRSSPTSLLGCAMSFMTELKPSESKVEVLGRPGGLRLTTKSISIGGKMWKKVQSATTSSQYRLTYPDVPADTQTSRPYVVQEGDTLTSIAKKFDTSVTVLAEINDIEDVNMVLSGESLLVPKMYERVPGPGVDIDEFPIPTGYELRAPHERIVHSQVGFRGITREDESTASHSAVKESHHHVLASSVVPASGLHLVKLALPVLFIAPLLGFCIRCIVDAFYVHMDKEENKRISEREALVDAHQPSTHRWQRILEEDREGDDSEGRSLMKEWPKDNVWRSELTGPTENVWSSELSNLMDPEAREKTREILQLDNENEVVVSDEVDDYEELRKSYAELESSYMKFLVDSGLSKSGYWREEFPPPQLTTVSLNEKSGVRSHIDLLGRGRSHG